MSIRDNLRKPLRFYIEIGILCLVVFLIFFICQRDKSFSFQEDIFNEAQYLFSKTSNSVGTFDFNVIGGSFLGSAGPPFLVSGKALTSLSDFSETREIERYIVQNGDNLSLIAEKFNISLETILWANNLSESSFIKAGKELIILPVSGVLHVVGPGDTLSEVARLYRTEMEEIIDMNSLSDPGDIYAGDLLIIPGGKKPKTLQNYVQVPLSGNYFICPIPSPCRITQGLHWYNAVDFSNGKCGEPVFAAAGGVIQRTGYGSVSGYYVRIQHPNNVITFYGHLSKIVAQPGQKVFQGQIIGYTGYSGLTIPRGPSGCHLHFDVRFAKNPFSIYPVGTKLGE